MSAIVAGKSCKKCKKEYWVSLGHPKWYDDVMVRRLPESENFSEYKKLTKSGMCLACFLRDTKRVEFLQGVEILVKRYKSNG